MFMTEFVTGELEFVAPGDIPADAVYSLWVRSGWRSDRALVPNEFNCLVRVEHDNGVTTYGGEYTKPWDDQPGHYESAFHFADVINNETLVGFSATRYLATSDMSFHIDKPFVSNTRTLEKPVSYQGPGLATRRLIAMNLASLAIYELPLHSGSIFSHTAASKCWDRLVHEGIATKYEEEACHAEPLVRYYFNKR